LAIVATDGCKESTQDLMAMGLNFVNAEVLKKTGLEPRVFCDLVGKTVFEKLAPVVLTVFGTA